MKNEEEEQSIFDELGEEANQLLAKGLLTKLIKESKEVVGDFGEILNSTTITTAEKLSKIQELEQLALSEAVKGFQEGSYNEGKYQASQRILAISAKIKATISLKHSLEVAEIVDFHNPKFSMAFGFLLELVVKTMTESGVAEKELLKVMDTLSIETMGFEDKLADAFHRKPLAQIPLVRNPFINNSVKQEVDYIDLYPTENEDVEDIEVEEPKKPQKRRKRKRKPKPKPTPKKAVKKRVRTPK